MTTKTDTEQGRAELLPCPFCGSDEIAINTELSISYVDCGACDTQGPVVEGSPAAAIAGWNRRAALQSQDRECAPDMFWNADDPESYGGECLHDAVVYATDEFSDSDLPVALTFQCAKRMPNITVRVTSRDENGNPVYEVSDQARRAEGDGE